MNEATEKQTPDLPREQYEPVLSRSAEMDLLEAEITVSAFDVHGDHVFKTCYGDICKTVNALRDYSRMLAMVCDTWDLQGFHRAMYEFHAEKLRKIADKFQAGIGYDYDAALERCRKKKEKQQRYDDVGGEAMAMGFLRARQTAEAKARNAAAKGNENQLSPPEAASEDDPWGEDI